MMEKIPGASTLEIQPQSAANHLHLLDFTPG